MRVLHLDTFSGIAGNMLLAALLDLGLRRKDLEADLDGLGVDYRLRVRKVKRGALAARYLDVRTPGARAVSHASTHHRPHTSGRRWKEIRRLLQRAKLEGGVRERALAIFEALAQAEGRIHGIPPEQVHFHEVGAVDAIVDVVGAAVGLARLGVEKVTATPVALGHGQAAMAHGTLPLPAPATLELLRGIPTTPAHVEWETVTPTGAAILRTVVDEFGPLPALVVDRIGYGAGNDRPGPMPNVLRAVLGRSGCLGTDRVAILECNLDDFIPEHFDHVMERLLEAGALDVGLQHLQMKKNRPGFLLRVLCRPTDRAALAALLFAETSTLGVRHSEWDRLLLERESRRVRTRFGTIRVKIARGLEGVVRASAEYDDCKRAARRAGVPLGEVVRAAELAAEETSGRRSNVR